MVVLFKDKFEHSLELLKYRFLNMTKKEFTQSLNKMIVNYNQV